jgi:hypothetical protein
MKRLGYAVIANPSNGWQFEFTSIPQDHKNLKILWSVKGDTNAFPDQMYIYFQINGTWIYASDGSAYTAWQRGTANGTMSWESRVGSVGYSYLRMPNNMMSNSGVYANDYGSGELTIFDYANTTSPYKGVVSHSPFVMSYASATAKYSYLQQVMGAYNSGTVNSQVTGIRIRSYSGSSDKYVNGSSCGLYALD